ncbi:MAG: ABC transporter substrate-binding protein [Syntrophaceae bacterium]|nr:ABC transporter substrate-binding protein [Syntrophaceae bacterium]
MRYQRLRILVLSLISLIISPYACLAEAEIKNNTARIGIYLPMTGVDAAFGQSEYSAIEIAHKLRPGVLGSTIELHFFDTKSEDSLASNAADILIKKYNVHALIGGTPDDKILPGSIIAEKERIPVVYPIVTYPLATQNNKYTFRVCATDSLEAKAAAALAYEIHGAKKAAIMIDISQDYAFNISNIFVKNFIERGGRIISATYCQPEDKALTEQISAIIAAKPDILYLPNYPDEVVLACKSAIESNLSVPILSSSKAQTSELIKKGENFVEGVIVPGHFAREAVTTDIAKQFIETYEKATGDRVTAIHALSADSYFLLLDAIERAKSFRGYDIRKALSKTKNFKAVSGTISMDSNGNAVKEVVFNQVKGGNLEYLTTVNP